MKRFFYILAALLIYSALLPAQTGYEWLKSFGGPDSDGGRCIIKSSDGGLIICGFTYTNNNADVFLVKTDSKGNKVWEKSFGDNSFEFANSIAENITGDFFITGSVIRNGNSDLIVMGISKDGNLLWRKEIGGSANDLGKSITVTSDNKLLVCGYTGSAGNGEVDIFAVKLDINGNIIWQKTFGGQASDIGTGIIEGADKFYYFVGSSGSYAAANRDVIIYKTDTAGAEIWKKNFNIDNFDFATQIIQTSDGGFAISGYSDFHGADLMNFSLWRTDANGKLLWSKTYDHAGFYDYARSLIQTADKGFIIGGSSKAKADNVNHMMLVKTDSMGNSISQKYIQGVKTYWGNSVIAADNSSVLITGYSDSFGTSGFDLILLKVKIDDATDIKTGNTKETGFNLFQNYPNPFNPSTTIKYHLLSPGDVLIDIYDANGRLVKNLVNSHQQSGYYNVEWGGFNNRGAKVSSGTYIVHLKTNDNCTTKKIMLLK